MREVTKQDVPFEHRVMSVPEALQFFGERKQDYKVDQIKKLDPEVEAGKVSIYEHNGFVDLCRGPHVERTGRIGPFKLLSIAGAYWRGNERNPQLQRIYGTVWPDQKQLDDYLKRLEEIEKRDHRALGRDLELFRIDEELGSGLVLWLPNLSVVREELEAWWRRVHRERGYTLVYTPHIASEKIYQRSGHLEKYGENMYGPLALDEGLHNFWIKPMNCPGHIKVYQSKIHSYRELPLRIGELGTVYRYERGGTLHGMQRVRGFTQDDSHIFCSWDQARDEIGRVFDLAMEFLNTFGYTDPLIYLSTRPEKRLGTDEMWDKAENALREALGVREVPYQMDEGGGVFYAPKIDIKMKDAIGREWQGPTIQIDLNLPERFDVTYVNKEGARERAVMIHRVLFGSLERFVGGLIEHFAGNFPLWLSWEQVAVIPVRESAGAYAMQVAAALRSRGFRVHLEPGDMRTLIKEAQGRRANYMLVVGDKEAAASTVSVRRRGSRESEQGVPLDAIIARLVEERDSQALPPDFTGRREETVAASMT
jgi:threonyl-tRNA synthetase